jgi:adenine/guanine phosphoribosyltransferase-like PRPP-binding protein
VTADVAEDKVDDLAAQVSVVVAPRQTRHQLVQPLDGRYGAMDPAASALMARHVLAGIDTTGIDVVLGIPEGGTIPAYAVAAAAGLPLALATRTVVDRPNRIVFEEPHVPDQPAFSFYDLRPGTRACLVEDEVTSGRTIVNAVRALRSAGIDVRAVATFILVDHPETRQRLADAGIDLHAGVRIDASFLERVHADAP